MSNSFTEAWTLWVLCNSGSHLNFLFLLVFFDTLQQGKSGVLPHHCPVEAEVQVPHLASVDTQGAGLPVTPSQRGEFISPVGVHWCILAWEGQGHFHKYHWLERGRWLPYSCVAVELLTLHGLLWQLPGDNLCLHLLISPDIVERRLRYCQLETKALLPSLVSFNPLSWRQRKLWQLKSQLTFAAMGGSGPQFFLWSLE